MKKLFVLLFALLCLGQIAAKVDLNTANFEELLQLPITERQARDILDYRTYISVFSDIYQLREIPSIDQPTLLRIKNLAVVSRT